MLAVAVAAEVLEAPQAELLLTAVVMAAHNHLLALPQQQTEEVVAVVQAEEIQQ
jgi:hypothetical protein